MKIFITMIFVIINTIVVAQQKNDWGKDNLKGAVKSIITIDYTTIKKKRKIEKVMDEREGNIELLDYSISYNQQGNIVKESEMNYIGFLQYKTTYEYDKKEKKIKGTIYRYGNEIHSTIFYQYDEKGNVSTENRVYPNGDFAGKTTYQYDEKGNVIEKIDYEDNHINYKETYQYDKRGNIVIKKFYSADGDLQENSTYQYNKNNDIIKEKNEYGTFTSRRKYTYKYDKTGNWVERIHYLHGEAIILTERTIEYY